MVRPSGRVIANPPEPGSREWYRSMSASKIAAVVGLSPYQSRFSLWHRMAGLIEPEPQTTAMSRGHYLEDGIARWFADETGLEVRPATSWMHAEVDWATATPDRDLETPDGPSLLEVKADDSPEWNPRAGTIPAYYQCQVQWQLLCSGLPRAHVACLGAYLELDRYVIDADPAEQDWLLTEARAFMDSLPGGPAERRPDLDGHTETYSAVRKLHPDISDQTVTVDHEAAERYRLALDEADAADAYKRHAASALLDLIGDARKAVNPDGETVAIRIPGRNGGPPFLRPGRTFRKRDAA
jgi:putative phage-type endonuclease